MTKAEFLETKAVASLSYEAQALWHDAHGHWEQAHTLCQRPKTREGDWVHAYLHRKEGDAGNAAYWYARAGKPVFNGTLDAEWRQLARELAGVAD